VAKQYLTNRYRLFNAAMSIAHSISTTLKPRISTHDLAAWGSVALFVVVYLVLAIQSAARNPLWMDEVLSVWASRFPTPSAINWALMHGAQSAPPAFSVLLHYYSKLVGQSNLALRMPSIVAGLLTVGFSFALFRRYIESVPAVFACCLLLESLSPYSLQVRPYTIMTACFAAALLLWDDLNKNRSRWRPAAIGLLLATAMAFHFYAVLFAPCLGLLELCRSYRKRELRPWLWVAYLIAGASIFLWWPVMRATRGYIHDDVSRSFAYGPKPTLDCCSPVTRICFRASGISAISEPWGLPVPWFWRHSS
jgi:uncharacterized membrane protein